MGAPVAPHELVPDGPLVARRLKITRKMVQEHGTTDGCAQCSHIRAFGEAKPGLAHSERCRSRLMTALGDTTAGAARLERYEERVDRAVASHHESYRGPTQEPPGASGVRGAMGVPSDEVEPTETLMATATSNRATSSRPLASPDTDMGAGDGNMTDDDDDVVTAMMSIGELKKRIQESQQHIQQLEDREASDVVQVLAMLGADPRSYRREHKQAVRRVVSEVYSPPRVTEMLKGMSNHGLTPGLALDITTTDPQMANPGISPSRANGREP